MNNIRNEENKFIIASFDIKAHNIVSAHEVNVYIKSNEFHRLFKNIRKTFKRSESMTKTNTTKLHICTFIRILWEILIFQ